MQRLLASLMTPLPPDEVGPCKDEWLVALHTATDLAQAIRCGQELLRQTSERVAAGHKARRLGDVSDEQNTWASALEECARGFVEQCAVLVETCSGAPPGLANRIYGCAVRLTEALGATESLLVALDNELLLIGDRVMQLELLYNVALQRVETVSTEVTLMEKKVERADGKASEATNAREEMSTRCRDMRSALQKAEKRAAVAEQRVSDCGRELQAAKRDTQSAQKRAEKAEKKTAEADNRADSFAADAANARRAVSATPREKFRKSFANLHATMSVGSTGFGSSPGESPAPISDQIGETSTDLGSWRVREHSPDFGSPGLQLPQNVMRTGRRATNADVRGTPIHRSSNYSRLSTQSRLSTASRLSTHSRMSTYSTASQPVRFASDTLNQARSASPRGEAKQHILDRQNTPFSQLSQQPPRRANSQDLSGDDGSACSGGARSQATTAKSNVTSEQNSDDVEAAQSSPLARGSIWACTLNKSNPLAASAQASFMHLTALVREAQERHKALSSPRGECLELEMVSPAEGLQQVAGHVRRWAETDLASVDSGLASTIGQSATHLQTLAGLSR